MAVTGGATTAYRCSVLDNTLHCSRTTTLRKECVAVADAIKRMARGETVVVKGSDMSALRAGLRQVAGVVG